jgi:RNA polymerase sigma-70 factor, ECF subfamily
MAHAEEPDRAHALDRLLAEYGPGLMRIALAYGREQADAQDLYQEICYAIWRALPSFRGEASVRTYIWRIANNRGITFRSRRRPAPDDHALEALPDPAPGPDQLADEQLLRDQLLTAVRELSPSQREVILLSLEGLANVEIGEVLGISANAVAVRLNRARAFLRARLDPRAFT